jgi:transposase
MKALICEMKEAVDSHKKDEHQQFTELPDFYLRQFYERYEAILAKAEWECPRALTRKQSKARNLLERLVNYKTEITRFTNDFNVPFDNNQAERDIRNVKIKTKVSGGFRTEKDATAFARIGSVISSATKQAKNVTNVIKNLLTKPSKSALSD